MFPRMWTIHGVCLLSRLLLFLWNSSGLAGLLVTLAHVAGCALQRAADGGHQDRDGRAGEDLRKQKNGAEEH